MNNVTETKPAEIIRGIASESSGPGPHGLDHHWATACGSAVDESSEFGWVGTGTHHLGQADGGTNVTAECYRRHAPSVAWQVNQCLVLD